MVAAGWFLEEAEATVALGCGVGEVKRRGKRGGCERPRCVRPVERERTLAFGLLKVEGAMGISNC